MNQCSLDYFLFDFFAPFGLWNMYFILNNENSILAKILWYDSKKQSSCNKIL